ncbi:NADH-ubiquinone oxidoreductase complex I subunit [Russula ochroleuca]|uniref:NADH-ubiquinone oxidoreductase complex I subunit n=1 Tax=Russula ochroleuca TaxID=152965 RepID=A0A9P5JVB3_9AGAM|nr:NADH-ubiquinone oxidoreductase complex I subunit [Russula ochroleuca]
MSALPFSAAHKHYIKSLYKHTLKNERIWVICYDLYRVCTEFECNWLTSSPFCSEEIFTVPVCSALAAILEKAEEELARKCHPGPYIWIRLISLCIWILGVAKLG